MLQRGRGLVRAITVLVLVDLGLVIVMTTRCQCIYIVNKRNYSCIIKCSCINTTLPNTTLRRVLINFRRASITTIRQGKQHSSMQGTETPSPLSAVSMLNFPAYGNGRSQSFSAPKNDLLGFNHRRLILVALRVEARILLC